MVQWLLDTKPYEVQREALKRSRGRKKYGFFLDIGLGKTQTCLAEFTVLLREGEVDAMCVVCPNSLKGNWEAEAIDSGVPIPVYHSPMIVPADQNTFIFCINAEALIANAGKELERLVKSKRVYLVVDESIMFKNHKAKRTKRLREIADDAEYIRLLSGEPMVNNPFDLWPQLRMLDADVNRNPYAFRNRYCVMGGWQGKQIVGPRRENLEELAQKSAEVSFTAEAKDWSDLPEKLFKTLSYEMLPRQAEQYKQMFTEMLLEIGDDEAVAVQMAVTKAMKCQQIGSGFILDDEGKAHDLMPPDKNPKLKALLEFRDLHPGKLIIVCRFRHSIDLVHGALSTGPDTVSIIMGGMDKKEIEFNKDNFNKGWAKEIILQPQSAKYGHTLLGNQESDPCHMMLFYEDSYSRDDRIQVEGRIRRHGQLHIPTYFDLIGCPEERKIAKAQQRKESVARALKDMALELQARLSS